MEYLASAFDYIFSACGWWGIALLCLLVASFFIQFYYYVGVYGRIPSFRSPAVRDGEQPGVSVLVVLVVPDYDYLQNTVPLILRQDYSAFEFHIVDLSGDVDFGETISAMAEHNPRLSVTRFVPDPRFPISMKMALNIGIKAVSHENILVTTADAVPDTDKWIARMAAGFSSADVVIGHCGILSDGKKGRRVIRMDNAALSMRWLGRAVRGKAYRGTISNLGFTKKVYFGHDGFSHLNMNAGIDDLFVQRITRGAKTAVVLSRNASVRRSVDRRLSVWYARRRFHSCTFRYYPPIIKWYIGAELWSRVSFFASCIILLAAFPFEIKMFAAAMAVLRLGVNVLEVRRVNKRLGEKGLVGTYILYDFLSPPVEAWMAVVRRLRRQPGLWR